LDCFPADDGAEAFAVLGESCQGGQIGGWIVRQNEAFATALGQRGGFGQGHLQTDAAIDGRRIAGNDQIGTARIAGVE